MDGQSRASTSLLACSMVIGCPANHLESVCVRGGRGVRKASETSLGAGGSAHAHCWEGWAPGRGCWEPPGSSSGRWTASFCFPAGP